MGHGLPLSDNFDSEEPGIQWYFNNEKANNFTFGNKQLKMKAFGDSFKTASEIYNYAPNISFEVTVKINGASKNAISGLRLGNEGIATDGENVFFGEGPDWRVKQSIYKLKNKKVVWLKIKNMQKDLSLFYSEDGTNWIKFDCSLRAHDSFKYGLFSYGSSQVIFEEFKYQGLE